MTEVDRMESFQEKKRVTQDNRFFEAFHALILEQNHITFHTYRQAQEFLTHRYKTKRSSHVLTEDHIIAYTMTRCPAIYAVLRQCLRELPTDFLPQRVLDLGAGPLTALFALLSRYQHFSYEAIEPHPFMYKMAKNVQENMELPCHIQLHNKTLEHFLPSERPYDLVIASYVLGEVNHLEKMLLLIFQAVEKFGLIVLPGTPIDFDIIKRMRSLIKEQGYFIVAPCGTDGPCPLSDAKERWCHFSVHVKRSTLHTKLKKGSLPFEYEKFTYLLFAKDPALQKKRLLSQPLHHKGHVTTELCCDQGRIQHIVSRKNKDLFKKVQKLHWGDALD